jgi:hypothetical protein
MHGALRGCWYQVGYTSPVPADVPACQSIYSLLLHTLPLLQLVWGLSHVVLIACVGCTEAALRHDP